MLEWIPVVLGVALAMLHLRRAISRRMLPWLVLACALASTVVSGELIETPWLLLADASLVLAGFAALQVVHAHLLRRRTDITSARAISATEV